MLDHLPAHVRRQVETIFRIRTVAEGEAIFRQGEAAEQIFFVLSGKVHLERIDHDGHQTVLCQHAAGDCFCPLAVLDGGPQLGTARALAPTTVLWASREEFETVCDQHPEFLRWLHRKCFGHVRHIVRRMETSMFHSVQERLIWTLLEHAQPQEEGPPLVRATHQDLAQWVGTSRETISRELAALRKEGLIRSGRGRIWLLRPDALQARLQNAALAGS